MPASAHAQNSSASSADIALPAVSIPERVHRRRGVLLWQARGASDCTFDGATHLLTAGHALWIPSGVHHSLDVHADSVVLPMLFVAKPSPGTLRTATWIAVDREMRAAILALLQVQNSIIQPEADLERRMLRMLHERTVPATGLPMPTSDCAYAIADELRRGPADNRPLAEIVAAHHISTRTVERAFVTETGMTLQEWRIRRRLEVAAAQLRDDDGVSAIASSVGYRSASAFRRAFKRHYGVSPIEYGRRFRVPS